MTTFSVDDIDDAPRDRGERNGLFVSCDGCPTHDLERGDVFWVLAHGDTGPDDCGESAGVVLLNDGRVVAWESSWDMSGAGFSADGSGGMADVVFSWTIDGALRHLSERARELLPGRDHRGDVMAEGSERTSSASSDARRRRVLDIGEGA